MSKVKQAINNKLQTGQGLLEFALIMPLLLLMTMGIIDFGRIFFIYGASSNASREAVRIGATDPDNCTSIDKAARSQLAFIPSSDYTVRIAYDDGKTVKYNSCQPSLTFAPGDRVVVDVRADFAPLTPVISSMFPLFSLHYTSARTIAYAGNDVPPPPPPPPPPTATPGGGSPAAASPTPPGATSVPTTPPGATPVPTTPPGASPVPTLPPTAVPTWQPTPTPSPVSPIMECTIDNGKGSYTAYFGYQSDNSTTVEIPIGSENFFSPVPQDRGQPAIFQPGRTAHWPNALFRVDFGGSTVWTLKSGGQTKTATASSDSHPCSQHVFIEKVWYDANANTMSSPPPDLPITYTLRAESILGTAICNYPSGLSAQSSDPSALSCTYTNRKTGPRPALDDNGLWAPAGTVYTVTEVGLPPGWSSYDGLGTYTSEIGGYCINGRNGYTKNCTHVVKNIPGSLAVTFVEGYPYRDFGSGNRDVYARVRVTFASNPVSGVTVQFTWNGQDYTVATDVNGYACTMLGKSQDSGETVDVTASKPGYQSGSTSGTTAPMAPPGGGGCP